MRDECGFWFGSEDLNAVIDDGFWYPRDAVLANEIRIFDGRHGGGRDVCVLQREAMGKADRLGAVRSGWRGKDLDIDRLVHGRDERSTFVAQSRVAGGHQGNRLDE